MFRTRKIIASEKNAYDSKMHVVYERKQQKDRSMCMSSFIFTPCLCCGFGIFVGVIGNAGLGIHGIILMIFTHPRSAIDQPSNTSLLVVEEHYVVDPFL
jgi:hypothetical protein